MGHPAVSTPHLDRAVATDAVSFRHAFAQATVCTPSRCSFMTGWYPHVRGHRTMHHMLNPTLGETNLLQVLRDNGYFVWWGGKNDLVPGQLGFEQHCDVHFRPGAEDYRRWGASPMPGSHGGDLSWRGAADGDNYYSFFKGRLEAPKGGVWFDGDWAMVRGAIDFVRGYQGDQPLPVPAHWLPASAVLRGGAVVLAHGPGRGAAAPCVRDVGRQAAPAGGHPRRTAAHRLERSALAGTARRRNLENVSCDNGPATAHGYGYACATGLRRSLSPASTQDPINDLEQRASRAFAAEFLAPAAGLARHLGRRASASPRQIDDLARLYRVSPLAIGHQIENHRIAWPSYSKVAVRLRWTARPPPKRQHLVEPHRPRPAGVRRNQPQAQTRLPALPCCRPLSCRRPEPTALISAWPRGIHGCKCRAYRLAATLKAAEVPLRSARGWPPSRRPTVRDRDSVRAPSPLRCDACWRCSPADPRRGR